ncbi:MAG TPA: C45 family peptidase [Coriobacteriia bacterium]
MNSSSDRLGRFAGTPREIGRAAGRALGPRLDENIGRYIRERPRRPDALDLPALRRGAMPWLRTLPQRFQDELEGLADGANLPLQRVAEWNYVESCVDDSCSGFVGRLGPHVWVARNNDMFAPDAWGYATIREVTGRIPTLSFGQEGDVFTATGVNRDWLWLHHQALPTSDAPRPGRPHLSGWVLLTDMLETCSTIGDVEARLGEVDRDEGMLLFAVDGKSDEFAILECTCSGHARRAESGAWLVGTNHVNGAAPSAGDESSRSRQARMEAMATELYERELPASLPGDLVAMLADDGVERRRQNFATAYAAVACPGSGELWFTLGGYPAASRGVWQRVPWPW